MTWRFISKKDGVPARKDHRCFFCGESIPRGSNHDIRTGVDEVISTMRMHPECNKATKDWGVCDYESFLEGEFERPKRVEGIV